MTDKTSVEGEISIERPNMIEVHALSNPPTLIIALSYLSLHQTQIKFT